MKRLPATEEESARSPIGLHPHNAPMQNLLVLRAVGAPIALAVTWSLFRRLETLFRLERTFG